MEWTNPFKKKPTGIEESLERLRILDRKLRVPARFEELDLEVSIVGSEEYVPIQAPFVKGKALWKDEPTNDNTNTFRNLWEKGAAIARHIHAGEIEHIFILSGSIEVDLFGSEGPDTWILDTSNPYVRIPDGVPHTALAREKSEFLISFEPCQK